MHAPVRTACLCRVCSACPFLFLLLLLIIIVIVIVIPAALQQEASCVQHTTSCRLQYLIRSHGYIMRAGGPCYCAGPDGRSHFPHRSCHVRTVGERSLAVCCCARNINQHDAMLLQLLDAAVLVPCAVMCPALCCSMFCCSTCHRAACFVAACCVMAHVLLWMAAPASRSPTPSGRALCQRHHASSCIDTHIPNVTTINVTVINVTATSPPQVCASAVGGS